MNAYRDSLVIGGSGLPNGEGQSQSGRVVRRTEERQAENRWGKGIKGPDQGWGWGGLEADVIRSGRSRSLETHVQVKPMSVTGCSRNLNTLW